MNGRAIGGGLDELRQVEAKYPALLFKQQLTAYLEKIYGVIRDRMKREIAPLLAVCIQVAISFGLTNYIIYSPESGFVLLFDGNRHQSNHVLV